MKILEQIQNNETIGLLLRSKKAILITLILVLGMIAGLYLIQQQQILKSRAEAGPTVMIAPYNNGKTFYIDQLKFQLQIDRNAFENER